MPGFVMMPHSNDDDLDPFEYRLLGHIRRRAGGFNGVCFASVASMAKTTRMSERKVRSTIDILKGMGLIVVESPVGGTYHIRPAEMVAYTPGESATPPLRKRHPKSNPLRKRHPSPGVSATPTPGESATLRINHEEDTLKKRGTHPKRIRLTDPESQRADEGGCRDEEEWEQPISEGAAANGTHDPAAGRE